MTKTKFALAGAAALALTSMLTVSPASAFTFHPATPAEMKQTDDLNAQALANARDQSATSQASFTNGTTTNSDSNMTTTPPANTDMSGKDNGKTNTQTSPNNSNSNGAGQPAPSNGQ